MWPQGKINWPWPLIIDLRLMASGPGLTEFGLVTSTTYSVHGIN